MLDIALIRREPDRVRDLSSAAASIRRWSTSFCATMRSTAPRSRRSNARRRKRTASRRRSARPRTRPRPRASCGRSSTSYRAGSPSWKNAPALSHPPTNDRRCARCSTTFPTCSTIRFPPVRTKLPTSRCAGGVSRARFGFTPKPHWELGEELGILDFARAARLSGSRFVVLRGAGARLARAPRRLLPRSRRATGLPRARPAVAGLAGDDVVDRAAQQIRGRDVRGRTSRSLHDSYGEVPLTALRGGEILERAELPQQYVAATPCFRKEAGAAGKDTRGLMRLHQFDKVELVWLTEPEASFAALETLTQRRASRCWRSWSSHIASSRSAPAIPGFNAAKTYDIEVWVPSSDAYREISSCSNCTDFQARRAAIRFRREATSKPELVHTLNGSGLAIGRTLIALLENHQQADGSVTIPAALQPLRGIQRRNSQGVKKRLG